MVQAWFQDLLFPKAQGCEAGPGPKQDEVGQKFGVVCTWSTLCGCAHSKHHLLHFQLILNCVMELNLFWHFSFTLAEVLALGFRNQWEDGLVTNTALLFLVRTWQKLSHTLLFVVICCFEAAEETEEFWESPWKHCPHLQGPDGCTEQPQVPDEPRILHSRCTAHTLVPVCGSEPTGSQPAAATLWKDLSAVITWERSKAPSLFFLQWHRQ